MKKILIVDDSLFMRKVLVDVLSRAYNSPANGYEIVEAASGAEAMEQFKKEKPDLVFLDIVMSESEEEGVRVLQELIKINSQLQVVMISAIGQDTMINKCKELGVKDYIVKPFDEKLIVETAKKYLK